MAVQTSHRFFRANILLYILSGIYVHMPHLNMNGHLQVLAYCNKNTLIALNYYNEHYKMSL